MRTHRVEPKETLTTLSRTYYGTPNEALTIWNHNRDIVCDPNKIYPGQVLVIPHLPHLPKLLQVFTH